MLMVAKYGGVFTFFLRNKDIGIDPIISLYLIAYFLPNKGIKGYAFDLAMEAGLVWPGLTAIVTMENDNCKTVENEVCSDEELWRAGLGRQNPHGGVPDSLAGDEDDAGPMSNPFTTSNAIAPALLSSLAVHTLYAL